MRDSDLTRVLIQAASADLDAAARDSDLTRTLIQAASVGLRCHGEGQ